MPQPRLLADRRRGSDRRAVPRRHVVTSAPAERRRLVDRRRGAERRSTLERRGHAATKRTAEGPAEHVRNALQLLAALQAAVSPAAEEGADLAAAVERLRRALSILERRPPPV